MEVVWLLCCLANVTSHGQHEIVHDDDDHVFAGFVTSLADDLGDAETEAEERDETFTSWVITSGWILVVLRFLSICGKHVGGDVIS